MKKFVRLMALMLVATMLVAVLAACGGAPAEDPKDAKKALKDADYEVTLVTGDAAELMYDGCEAYLTAQKIDGFDMEDLEDLEDLEGETITIEYLVVYYFEDEDAAEEAFDDGLEDALEAIVEGVEESFEMYDEFDIEVEFDLGEVTLDGCMVYVGTSGALSDAS